MTLRPSVLAQHAVVNEDTGEAVADGTVEQDGGHAGVNTAGKSEDDAVIAQLLFQLGHGAVDKRGGTPFLSASANVDHEVLQELRALHGVEHLGVELNGEYCFGWAPESGVLHVLGRTDHLEALGDGSNGVAVAHPYLRVLFKAFEERVAGVHRL